MLLEVTSSCRQPPKAPVSDWSLGLVDIPLQISEYLSLGPKLRYSDIYDYLVASNLKQSVLMELKWEL